MPDKARIIFVRQRNGDFIAEPDFRNIKSRGAEITGSLFRGSFMQQKIHLPSEYRFIDI